MNLEELKATAEAATPGLGFAVGPNEQTLFTWRETMVDEATLEEVRSIVITATLPEADAEFFRAADRERVLALVKVVEATQRFIRHIDAPSFGSHFCDLCLTDNSEGHRPDCEWLLFDKALKELEAME